jgi:hypothetical protein
MRPRIFPVTQFWAPTHWLVDYDGGETDVSEPRPSLAYCSSPGECKWIAVMMMMPVGDNSWLVYQRQMERVGGMDEDIRILRIQYLWCVNGSFTCRNILRHGTSGFTSYRKECVLRIFIALKNASPRSGLIPLPLGLVASTLTTTSPRRRPDP